MTVTIEGDPTVITFNYSECNKIYDDFSDGGRMHMHTKHPHGTHAQGTEKT